MTDRAKLFTTGGSQAVRLPRSYRFPGEREVLIRRDGRRVVIESVRREWSPRFLALAGSAPDFSLPEEPGEAEPGPNLG
jgi:antitoxin VapB